MLSINTNLSSLIAQQSLSSSTTKLNQAIERMSTGFKINHAKDNAANYSISTNLTTKIGAYMVAEDNVAMGLDMLSTANGSLDQISDKLTRIRSLATQASNGTYGTQSLNAINSEVNALVDEINRLYQTAEYNGIKLFGQEQSQPAAATYAMARTASAGGPGSFYTDEEIAAMTELTDSVTTITEGGKYTISDANQLAHLAELVNGGAISSINDVTFVLTDDIDLKEWCETHEGGWTPIGNDSYGFHGTFDGNGYVISNLTIDRDEYYQGLFGYVYANGLENWNNATIKNVGLEDINVTGGDSVGGLAGQANAFESGVLTLSNNYATGNVAGSVDVGGLVGMAYAEYGTLIVSNNYTTGSVSGNLTVGGLVGYVSNYGDTTISNNYSTTTVIGSDYVGGLVGFTYDDDYSNNIFLTNNYATGTVTGTFRYSGFIGDDDSGFSCTYLGNVCVQADRSGGGTQMTAEEILAPANLEAMGFTEANGWTIVNGQPVASYSMTAREANNNGGGGVVGGPSYITLQVGINASEHSQIGVDLGFSLTGIDDLRMIGLDTTTDFLTHIDNMLSTVNAKEVEYGAAQNRLESALEEISTQYENLVSSRSTIRDADIAEVSSQYIQQQILQQASATLLATANQSPSIALQLI